MSAATLSHEMHGRWTSRTAVKLRFWSIRHNPFARHGRCQNWSKIAILKYPPQPFRTKWMLDVKNWGKIAILRCQSHPFRTKRTLDVKNWSKIAILRCQSQPFRAKWTLDVKNGDTIAILEWMQRCIQNKIVDIFLYGNGLAFILWRHLRIGSKRDTSGEDLSELSGLPLATSAVSAGDVGDGETDARDGWSAGASCSRPHGSVGTASLLCRWQTAGGGSNSRWSVSKIQAVDPPKGNGLGQKKKICWSFLWSHDNIRS